MGSFLTNALGVGNGFTAQAADITKQDFSNTINNAGASVQGANQLLQNSALGQGPNPALAQLQQTTNQNIAQNAGMLASQRGLSPALAQRLAAQNGAAMNQQAAGQAATLSAQQQLGAQQALANNSLGMYNSAQNAQAAQNNALVGMQTNMNNVNAGVAAQNAATAGGLVGGALQSISSIGSMLGGMFAEGGTVGKPVQHFDSGGPVLQNWGFNDMAPVDNNAVQSYAGRWLTQGAEALKNGMAAIMNPEDKKAQGADNGLGEDGHTAPDMAGGPGDSMGGGFMSPGGDMGGGAGDMMGGLGGMAMLAARGGRVPSGMAGLRMARGGDPQGMVHASRGQQAVVKGDSLKNDKVPAMLSAKEIVLPRSVTMHPNAPELAAEFVRREMRKGHHADSKKNFDEGGQVPQGIDANAPQTQLQPVNAGFDPGQAFIPTPPTDYGQVYENKFQELRKMNPGEPEAFSRASALQAAEGMKQADDMSANWNQAMSQQSQQQAHDQAIAENTRRQALGMKPIPIPEAPVDMQGQMGQIPGDMSEGMNQPGGAPNPNAQANPMAGLDQAMLGNYMKAANEQKAGINMAASAQQELGEANSRIAAQQMQQQQKLMDEYKVQNNQLMDEYSKAMEDYKNGSINPNHYMQNMSTAGKVSTAIGLILGGLGSGLLHNENPAVKFLNSQIDRDIDAQKANLGKKATLLEANYRRMGNLRDATEMTRAMMMGIQANQFRQAAANAQGPMAKATAMQEAGKIDERIAPIISQISMRQALMKSPTLDADPAAKIHYLSMSGIMPKEDKQAADKELAQAGELEAIKRDLKDAVQHIHKQTLNGAFSPYDTQSAKMALAGRIVKLTEGRFNQEAAMNIVDAFFPRSLEGNQTTRNKVIRGEKTINGMIQTPVLDQYGIKVPTRSNMNFNVGQPVGGR